MGEKAVFNKKTKKWKLWKWDDDYSICSLCGKKLSPPFYYCADKQKAWCSKACEEKSHCRGTARRPEHIHILIDEAISQRGPNIMKKQYYCFFW